MNFEVELKNYIGAIRKAANDMYLESNVCDKDDLEQAGILGMISGLNSFSPVRAKAAGTKKTTYVIQCIRNSVMQEANKFYGAVSLPHNKRLRLNSFRKLLNKGLPKEDIKTLLRMSDTEYANLERIAKLGQVNPVPESLVDETRTEDDAAELFSLLEEVKLTDDERQLLRFKLEGQTYTQIAEHYGLSRETMRKRVHKVIEKIRNKAE
jgi:RNA polymerase sigma factor (sigma-70 family)